MDQWARIIDFPDYSVSDQGEVQNNKRESSIAVRQNHQGVAMVNLTRMGRQHTRALAPLVATYFVEGRSYIFDTPINKNGERVDCRASNLEWRPRWFAIRYHNQFDHPPYTFTIPIVCLDTNEVFDTPREAAVKYGLLESGIVEDLHNENGVWPLGYDFRFYKP